jgi:hypothetical protein
MHGNLLAIGFLVMFAILSQSQVISSKPEFSQQYSQTEVEKNEIVGFWRGYYQTKKFTMYYAYEFRRNGSYLARHRVYQNEATIRDEIWEGQWELDNNLLYLKGANITNRQRTVRIRFQLKDNNKLEYDGGTLPRPYLPRQLGKEN